MFSIPRTDQCPRNRGKPENGNSEGASQRVALSGLRLSSKGRCQIWHPGRTHAALPFRPLPESPERFHLQTPNTDTGWDDQDRKLLFTPRHEFFSLDPVALNVLSGVQQRGIRFVETAFLPKQKAALFQQLKAEAKEGVVFKACEAPYTSGRPNTGGSQLKFKFVETASFAVRQRIGICFLPPGTISSAWTRER